MVHHHRTCINVHNDTCTIMTLHIVQYNTLSVYLDNEGIDQKIDNSTCIEKSKNKSDDKFII